MSGPTIHTSLTGGAKQPLPPSYRLYKKWEDCTFKERAVKVLKHVGTLLKHAGIGAAVAGGIALTSVVAISVFPILAQPMICFIAPTIGYSGATIVNGLIGGIPGLISGYGLNTLMASPPADIMAREKESPERKLARMAAKLHLFTIAGALIGGVFISAGHNLNLLQPCTWPWPCRVF